MNNDLVNHPSHYTYGDVETIDMMVMIFGKEATANHCRMTAYKYLSRYKHKGNPKQDLEKARWYAAKAYSLSDFEEPYFNVLIPEYGCDFDRDYMEYYVEQAKIDLVWLQHDNKRLYSAELINNIDNAIACVMRKEEEREA